jgi:hypothetical protein
MVLKFTKDVDTDAPTEMPKPADFEHGLHTGENCFYFFIKRGDRIYPVMPRRFLSVLFDTWGTNLKDYFPHYRKNSQTLRASDTNRIPPLRTRAIRQMFKTGIVYD